MEIILIPGMSIPVKLAEVPGVANGNLFWDLKIIPLKKINTSDNKNGSISIECIGSNKNGSISIECIGSSTPSL